MNVSLISVTPEAEKIIMYCARVSSNNQDSENPKLLKYCLDHGHFSIYEQAFMTLEIITSRAIGEQILRHRSFTFQAFSQRYAEVAEFEIYDARRQDLKNRQNSIDDLPQHVKAWFLLQQQNIQDTCMEAYKEALLVGVAKELARMLLPLSTSTKLYMSGSIRSWLHYLDTRTHESTQKEHRDVANAIKSVFIEQFPIIAKAKGWL